jgi:hypothetical protein
MTKKTQDVPDAVKLGDVKFTALYGTTEAWEILSKSKLIVPEGVESYECCFYSAGFATIALVYKSGRTSKHFLGRRKDGAHGDAFEPGYELIPGGQS